MGLSEIDDSDAEPSEEEEQKSPEKEEKMTYEQAAQILGVAEDEEDEAANVIRKTLKKTYDRDMVMIFGRLAPRDDNSQLADVEAWIEKHGEQPELMLVAGRLCLARQLWGRARHYLDSEAAARVEQMLSDATSLLDGLDSFAGSDGEDSDGLEMICDESGCALVVPVKAVNPAQAVAPGPAEGQGRGQEQQHDEQEERETGQEPPPRRALRDSVAPRPRVGRD